MIHVQPAASLYRVTLLFQIRHLYIHLYRFAYGVSVPVLCSHDYVAALFDREDPLFAYRGKALRRDFEALYPFNAVEHGLLQVGCF